MSTPGLAEVGTDHVLERAAEQRTIDAALGAARQGRGSVIAVEGEAGIGKSTLLAYARTSAASRGMGVLGARGGELERELPYGVVCQLVEPLLVAATDEQRARMLAGAASLAAPAWSLETPASAPRRGAVLHGLYWLTANLAEERPLLLSVDDVHCADQSSLEFLSYLARRIDELPIAIVHAARVPEVDAERVPDDLRREIVLRLASLRGDSVAALVGAQLGGASPAFARACQTATRGNPFLLHELLRALADDGTAPVDENAERVARLAPEAIARAILARLRPLGAPAARLAFAVAVLGREARVTHAARIAGLDVAAADGAADALAAAGILERRRPLEFVHPVVRRVVHDEVPRSRRSQGHREAARLLFEEQASAEAVAAHLLASDPIGDPWTVARLRESAAALVRRGAPRDAARQLRRAQQEGLTATERASVLLELGAAEARAGVAGAAATLANAHRLAAAPALRISAACELAQALTYHGDVRDAVSLLQRTLEEVGEDRSETARAVETQLLVTAGMTPSTIALVGPRLQDARRAARNGDPVAAAVRAVLALAAVSAGRAADSATLATAALEDGLAETAGPESPALYFATCALTLADGGARALAHLDTALRIAREQGSARGVATASSFRGFTRCRVGDLRGAEADALAALELSDGAGMAVLGPALAATLIDCLVERAELDRADAVLEDVDWDASDPASPFTALLHESAARLHLARQRPHAALRELEACAAWATRGRVTRPAWVSWRAYAALAHLAEGSTRRAAALAREELEAAREFGGQRSLAIALRVSGLTATPAGVDLLAPAAEAAARSGDELEHARCLLALGAALRRAGRRREARAPLRHALDCAEHCGAHALASSAEQELTASGASRRPAALSGADALTASERRVALMAAGGMSNREIAQALFVTVRTVEGHLTHAYQKLDIGARADLSAALGAGRAASP